MFRKSLITLIIALVCASVTTANAQTFLKDKNIPKDLVDNIGSSGFDIAVPKDLIITLETSGIGQHYKYVIKANGSVTFYPITVTTFTRDGIDVADTVNKKKKNKLSNDQLKELTTEFEEIDFFNLSDRYKTAEDGCTMWISGGGGSTIISIQINRKTKKVVYENGCVSDISNKFRSLKNKIQEKALMVEANVVTKNADFLISKIPYIITFSNDYTIDN